MTSHWLFIGAGYALTWLALGAYLLRLRRRERALESPDEPHR